MRRIPCLCAIALSLAWLSACSTANGPVQELPDPPQDVALSVQWRLALVDSGIFPYRPTELGRIALTRDGRTVFVGTSDGRMVAVDGSGASILWQFQVGEPIDGWPTLAGNQLYFTASNGKLYALNAHDGSLIWEFEAGGNLDSRPAVTDRHVVFANAAGSIVCLDRARGVPLWTVADEAQSSSQVLRQLHLPIKGQASPEVAGDRVFAGFPSGRLACMALDSGEILWSTDLAGSQDRHVDVDQAPVLIGDLLIASSFSAGLYALDPGSGRIVWHHELRGATRPVRHGDRLLTTTVDSELVSLDLQTGQPWFTLRLQDRSPGPIELFGDYAVTAMSRGGLLVAAADTPHLYYRFDPDGGFASMAAADADNIYALGNAGVLYKLRLHWR